MGFSTYLLHRFSMCQQVAPSAPGRLRVQIFEIFEHEETPKSEPRPDGILSGGGGGAVEGGGGGLLYFAG
jgi:hypothetical protein